MNKQDLIESFKVFNNKRDSLTDRYYCEIHPISLYQTKRNNNPIIFGINWSALGTVDIGNTLNFIKQLSEASILVNELNEAKMLYEDLKEVI